MLRLFFFAACIAVIPMVQAADPFPLRNGDVVALVGNTFIEREQRDGYIELALTLAHPDTDIAFRNLGWSGDTVAGRARRFFGSTEEGFKHLLDHLDVVQPTVILVSYGTNEAFDGKAGREDFLNGYRRLLDELQKRTDRIALITSPPLDPRSSPAPQVATHANDELEWQVSSLKSLATERGLELIDVYSPLSVDFAEDESSASYTENGIHLTSLGYQRVAEIVTTAATRSSSKNVVEVGRSLTTPQETVRQAIVAKNELFFHRHRPQNETYLRGFRKHEQGNNATEIFAFEPLAKAKDREIFDLRRSATE